MRTLFYMSATFSLILCASSCDKGGEEDEDWCLVPSYRVPVNVRVSVDDTFREFVTSDSVFGTRTDAGAGEFRMKYYVAVFPRGGLLPEVVASAFDSVVPVNIHPGKYTLVGWADYESEPGGKGGADNFHTDDFTELLLKNKYSYTGAARNKLGFRGVKDSKVAYNSSLDSVTVRPAMGLYRLVSTDTAAFTPARVVVKYASSLPAAINTLDGGINWWWDDIGYTSIPRGTALASDYVFSSDVDTTSVTVAVEVYDGDGTLRARKRGLRIPLRNGGITTVRGNFLSVMDNDPAATGGGGISIKTEWDATFEIEI